MDIFKSMNQTKVADFSVFKSKKKNPVATEEQKKSCSPKRKCCGQNDRKNGITYKRRSSCRAG